MVGYCTLQPFALSNGRIKLLEVLIELVKYFEFVFYIEDPQSTVEFRLFVVKSLNEMHWGHVISIC